MTATHAIGVDLGGTKILAGVVTRDGSVVREHERATPIESQDALVVELEAAIAEVLGADVGAIGLGVPGPRDLVETIAGALTTKAMPLDGLDRRGEGRIVLEGALALALSHDLHAAALRAYNNLAGTLQEVDPRQALATADAGIELARRLGHAPLEDSLG